METSLFRVDNIELLQCRTSVDRVFLLCYTLPQFWVAIVVLGPSEHVVLRSRKLFRSRQ